ncbi:9713_t:CDS:2 [Funneliformis mosseae]|uniref:9713_t:CDS:1 n=1 Tax=Funneliformis mosseae TaxID=27381 RepID=A0A9N9CGT2_FUNMO|nr:9713_t:CDS:2 [Funneliformis mosseae]
MSLKSNMKTSKLLRTISMIYHIQEVKQNFNPSAKGFENLLGFCVIDQLKRMNESEKIVLNIGGMPNQEIIERRDVDIVDEATKNLNLFIQMLHQVIFESRSNFKNQIELTFLQSQDNTNTVTLDSTISTTPASNLKKYTVLPRIQRIQSLAYKFKENGFDILELFGDEISSYFIQRNINFQIITSHDPNLYRIVIHLPKFDIMNKSQIIENSIIKITNNQCQAEL